MTKKVFTMTIGIPSSGKSTIRQKEIHKNPNICILSSDDIRKRMLNYDKTGIAFDQDIEEYVWNEMNDKFNYCIEKKKHIFFDATNVEQERRTPFIDKAKINKYQTKALLINIDPEIAFLRQRKRERKVPKSVMYRMYYDMQKPTLQEFNIIQKIDRFANKKECIELKGKWIKNKKRCQISRLI